MSEIFSLMTLRKVCGYIDGTNHVSRIAYLADCDLELTRKAIRHLLFVDLYYICAESEF